MGPIGSLDATWKQLRRRLPPTLASGADDLPAQLGLTRSGEGWDAFLRTAPNRDLPLFALDGVEGDPDTLTRESRARYTEAHHLAAMFGLVADRLEDAQVEKAPSLVAFRQYFLREWAAVLSAACGSAEFARGAIARDLRLWRRASAVERSAFVSGQLSVDAYARLTESKLRWVSTSSAVLLHTHTDARRGEAFVAANALFLRALQCRDDAFDEAEDRHTRGRSFPEMIGLPAGGFVRAAVSLVGQAAVVARAARFGALADWLERYVTEIDVRLPGGHPLQDEMAGMIIADASPTLDSDWQTCPHG
ncbi:MAG: hypothetical protein Q8S73_23995 [Deltaproteobacteria bacterium]|nr:hypothetical protein [Myxococcales bacterium]MDP3217195.1 hypothetical protein [Deltaproteobacteria bacterium]